MNANPLQRRDLTMIGLVSAPIVALVLLMAAAGIRWKTNNVQIRSMLMASYGQEIVDAPSALATVYDSQTETDQSLALRQVMEAATALNKKYGHLVDQYENSDPDLEQRALLDKYIQPYADEAEPIEKALAGIDFSRADIWLPIEPDSRRYWASVLNDYRSINYLLFFRLKAAIQAKESAEAIKTLDLYNQVFGDRIAPGGQISEQIRLTNSSLVYEAIATGVENTLWNEEELRRVDAILPGMQNLQQNWNSSIEIARLRDRDWILTGRLHSAATPNAKFIWTAPSERIQRYEWSNELQSLNARTFLGHYKSFRSPHENVKLEIDSLLQFPMARQSEAAGQGDWEYLRRHSGTYNHADNDRRFVRTAIAIIQYKNQFKELPKRLSDLGRVGLPDSATLDHSGQLFSMHVGDSNVTLYNTSVYWTKSGDHGWRAARKGNQYWKRIRIGL